MNVQVNQNERLIRPSDPAIRYTGRIDNSNPDAPFLIYVCSQVEFRVTGHVLRVFIENIHSFYENRLGVIINGVESAVLLESGAQVIDLSDRMTDGENHVLLFKRQDCCHALVLHGFAVAQDAELLPLPPRPKRRMEVYGDSVSAGEVSEAEFACGQVDPEGHNGRYSNGYLSYSWQTARLLGAELHDIAQGGIALLDGTGYFCSDQLTGMESCYDKIQFSPYAEKKQWDFSRWTPDAVIIAIGQNDANPEPERIKTPEYRRYWKDNYIKLLRTLMEKYPAAKFVLILTILGHDHTWDDALEEIAQEVNSERVTHFMFRRTGCGTNGHPRATEQEEMAGELYSYFKNELGF